jgi:predicted metal-binding membrane protein
MPAVPILAPGARVGPYANALLWCLPAAITCWLLIAASPVLDIASALCLPRAVGTFDSLAANLHAQAALVDPLGWSREWLLMIGAMMLPLAIPPLQFVARQSFARRRQRALVLWILGFFAVTALAGVVASLTIILLRGSLASIELTAWSAAIGYALAAGWQLSETKRRALVLCHVTPPLRPFGIAADLDATRFGLGHGWRCSRSCLPVMVPVMVAGPSPMEMFVVFALLLAERSAFQPDRRFMVRTAVILLAVGLIRTP